jgi:DNA-binding response OmpR family regulator
MAEPGKTVLIVDDEPQMLRLLKVMLGPQQVEVLSAPRPSEALRICGERSIDVLISDFSMPEMDGGKLAERVWKIHPNVAILMISGERAEAPRVKGGSVRFLKKPFFPGELIRVLREMLGGTAQSA